MQILRAETIPIELPFRERYLTASGQLEGREMILFRLVATGEIDGWGEGVPLTLRGGEAPARTARDLRELCSPALTGADLSPARGQAAGAAALIRELRERCHAQRPGAPALAAVDIALHDLIGKLLGVPAWRLLGVERTFPVECNASIDAAEPERAAEAAAAWARAGFVTFKVKVGTGADSERVAAVREAVGPRAQIRIDANRAWGAEEAIERITELDEVGLELVEQPCPSLEELAVVRAAVAPPLVADESVASLGDARRAREERACDAATVKLSKVGGPLAALQIAAELPSYLSSALDGPLGIAAALHTAQAMPRGGWTDRLAAGLATLGMFASAYAPSAELLGARPEPPLGPGLGVEVDEAAVEALALA